MYRAAFRLVHTWVLQRTTRILSMRSLRMPTKSAWIIRNSNLRCSWEYASRCATDFATWISMFALTCHTEMIGTARAHAALRKIRALRGTLPRRCLEGYSGARRSRLEQKLDPIALRQFKHALNANLNSAGTVIDKSLSLSHGRGTTPPVRTLRWSEVCG